MVTLMPQNEVQRGWNQFDEWFVAEILLAQARFMHICLAAIMPKELYDLAAADNQLPRCQQWAKDHGYYWRQCTGETQLMKGPHIAARFKPVLVGEGKDKHVEFMAAVLGKRVDCHVPEPERTSAARN